MKDIKAAEYQAALTSYAQLAQQSDGNASVAPLHRAKFNATWSLQLRISEFCQYVGDAALLDYRLHKHLGTGRSIEEVVCMLRSIHRLQISAGQEDVNRQAQIDAGNAQCLMFSQWWSA